jgi:hypothetical protein
MSEPLPVNGIGVGASARIDVDPKRLGISIRGEDLQYATEGDQKTPDLVVETAIFDSVGKIGHLPQELFHAEFGEFCRQVAARAGIPLPSQ